MERPMVVLAGRWRIVRSIRLSTNAERHQTSDPSPSAGRKVMVAAALISGLMLAGAPMAFADSGVSTFVPKKDDPDAMSAGDFFKLIDKSVNNKFKDMIVVMGGCYSSGFSDSAENSKA